MKEKLRLYINENLEKSDFGVLKKASFIGRSAKASYDFLDCSHEANIEQFIEDNKNENKFQKLLFNYIDSKNLKDSDVYNKVDIDRRLFSKIRSDLNYHPSKETVILLALALELSLDEAIELLESASYSLPKNNVYDLIIRFCFINSIYSKITVNELLQEYNCNLI